MQESPKAVAYSIIIKPPKTVKHSNPEKEMKASFKSLDHLALNGTQIRASTWFLVILVVLTVEILSSHNEIFITVSRVQIFIIIRTVQTPNLVRWPWWWWLWWLMNYSGIAETSIVRSRTSPTHTDTPCLSKHHSDIKAWLRSFILNLYICSISLKPI